MCFPIAVDIKDINEEVKKSDKVGNENIYTEMSVSGNLCLIEWLQ